MISEELVKIYRYFNVYDQTKKTLLLSVSDLYLLLLCCIEMHNCDDPTVISNFVPFEYALMQIRECENGSSSGVPELNELFLRDGSEPRWMAALKNLPPPYTRDEIRNLKLEDILE